MAAISDEQARAILERPWVVRPQEWELHTAHNTVRGADRSWQVALKADGAEEGPTITTVYHPSIAEEIVNLHNEALEMEQAREYRRE